jgi:hypothetical protein
VDLSVNDLFFFHTHGFLDMIHLFFFVWLFVGVLQFSDDSRTAWSAAEAEPYMPAFCLICSLYWL